MARSWNWATWRNAGLAAALATAVGCNDGGKNQIAVTSSNAKPPVASIPSGPKDDPVPLNLDPKLHQPFEQACVTEIDANVGVDLPPAMTMAGKSSGTLNDQVHRIWDSIKFVDHESKPVTYLAELQVVSGDKELGTIELIMRPDVAPNHVRNFVALATLNYYDGLRIDRIVQQQGDGEGTAANKLVLLEAGSPTEDAEPATSHLGYWLKPEFSETVKHEEGTVGACLLESEDNAETAAVRFYLNLTAAPVMDGNYTIFAKVVKGLDIAKRMAEMPVVSADPGPDQGRPAQPITIKKVHVRAVPVQ